MKIKVKLFPGGQMPQVNEKGDLFDVFSRETVRLCAPKVDENGKVKFNSTLVNLGFAMEIPKGFKANLFPRSSTYHKWKIIFGNHVGQIDHTYRGDNDEWKASCIALEDTLICADDKIAQFEIVPSSKATVWQKLKWLFSNKIEFVEVESLNNADRSGFGSTGSK